MYNYWGGAKTYFRPPPTFHIGGRRPSSPPPAFYASDTHQHNSRHHYRTRHTHTNLTTMDTTIVTKHVGKRQTNIIHTQIHSFTRASLRTKLINHPSSNYTYTKSQAHTFHHTDSSAKPKTHYTTCSTAHTYTRRYGFLICGLIPLGWHPCRSPERINMLPFREL